MKLFGMAKTNPSVKVDIKPPHAAWQERAQAFVAYAQRQLRSPEGQPVLEYLHTQRGLTDETIYAWNLGAANIDGKPAQNLAPPRCGDTGYTG